MSIQAKRTKKVSAPRTKFKWPPLWMSALALLTLIYLGARLFALGDMYCHIDECGILRDLLLVRTGDLKDNVREIFRLWTNSPGKFFFLLPAIRRVESLDSILWLGRLSSVFIGMLGFLGFAALLWRHTERRVSWAWILTLLLVAFSAKELANAQQAFHYSFSTGAMVAILYALDRFSDAAAGRKKPQLGHWLVLGLLAGVLTWFQYQMLIVFPCLLAALAIYYGRKHFVKMLPGLAVSAAAFVALVVPLYEYTLGPVLHHSVADWSREFVLQSRNPIDTAVFFVRSWWLLIASSVMLGPDYWMPYWPLAALVVTAIGLGARHSPRWLWIFGAVCVVVWSLGAAARRFQISPTRHTLILAPLIWILCFFAFKWLEEKYRKGFGAPLLAAACAAVLSLGTWGAYRYNQDRRDLIRPNLPSVVEQTSPDLIVTHDWTEIPQLMYSIYESGKPPSLKRSIAALEPRFEWNATGFIDRKPKRVLWVSHRGAPGAFWENYMAQRGYRASRKLAEVSTSASQEPWSGLNGTNGFYAFLFELY